MQNPYLAELADFHNVCDDAGVPAGNTGLRVRWLVERVEKVQLDSWMPCEQMKEDQSKARGAALKEPSHDQ